MARTKISEFSATPANNTDIDSINISEGCAPSGINDAIRELMAQLKDFQTGAVGDSFNGPIGTSTAAAGAFTTLSASSTVTLSGGTANGVPYLNGSKVLTSGSALVFDGTNFGVGTASPASKLSVYGTGGDSAISFFGSAGTPVGYMGSTSVGNYIIGALANETFIRSSVGTAFSSDNGASVQMRLNTSGNLGIGVASPAYKLDVNGTAGISGNLTLSGGTANGVAYLNGSKGVTSGSALTFDGTNFGTTGNANLGSGSKSTDTQLNFLADTGTQRIYIERGSRSLVFYDVGAAIENYRIAGITGIQSWGVGGSEAMRLTSTGLGIGTSSPSEKLAVAGSVTADIYKLRSNQSAPSSTDAFIYRPADNTIGFGTASAEKMRIDSSGNVGIGTSSPASRLTVSNSSGGNVAAFTNTSSADLNINLTAGVTLLTPSTGTLAFGTSNTERARIDDGGRWLVGTTTEQGFVTIQNPSANSNGLNVICSSTGASNYVLNLQSNASVANTAFLIRGYSNTSTGVFFVAGNGNVTNTNNSYGAISDAKLKENVTDATPKLEKLNQVRVVNYNLIGDSTKQLGVVAQELEQVFPAMVDESPDIDKEGNDLGTTTKSVKYSVFVPILIKALQEQQAIIDSLKARLDAANL